MCNKEENLERNQAAAEFDSEFFIMQPFQSFVPAV